jgi:hypothetical protein
MTATARQMLLLSPCFLWAATLPSLGAADFLLELAPDFQRCLAALRKRWHAQKQFVP